MIKSSIDTDLLLVISVFSEPKITVDCCVTQYPNALCTISLKDGNTNASGNVHVFDPKYQGCPILICTEVNQLARSAPFSLEGEGLGMRVFDVARC